MFKQCDLKQSLSREDYDAAIDGLRERLGVLQREFRDRKIPVIVVFEGWRFSGISDTINRLTYALDPRGFRVHLTKPADAIERDHVPLWRFWKNMPVREKMAIFDRSWYSDTVLRNYTEKTGLRIPPSDPAAIVAMETMLADDGVLFFKFFLHISKKDQKARIKKMKKDHPELVNSTSLFRNFREDDRAVSALEKLLEKTSTDRAPWTLLEATDRRFTINKVFTTMISAMEARLKEPVATPPAASAAPAGKAKKAKPAEPAPAPLLDALDLSLALPEADYLVQMEKYGKRLGELQFDIHKEKIPVVMVFEGCDAAGKGGAIIRLDRALNPRCSVVEPVAAPTPEEKGRHYLWRFVCNLPEAGDITIFDRSWYGRVLVERVEGFCTTAEWQRAYDEINRMEEYLVRNGTVLLKFWLQIDQDVQLQRFHERETDPLKKYKITDEDWRNREKWDVYRSAIEEMLEKTGTKKAPWVLVEANDKHYARIRIMKTVIRSLEKAIAKRQKKATRRS